MNVNTMDTRLRALFDRQRKVSDPRMARLIGETETRWGAPIADDDLESVAAAGDPDAGQRKTPWDERK